MLPLVCKPIIYMTHRWEALFLTAPSDIEEQEGRTIQFQEPTRGNVLYDDVAACMHLCTSTELFLLFARTTAALAADITICNPSTVLTKGSRAFGHPLEMSIMLCLGQAHSTQCTVRSSAPTVQKLTAFCSLADHTALGTWKQFLVLYICVQRIISSVLIVFYPSSILGTGDVLV